MTVTLVMTPLNAIRLSALIDRVIVSGHLIRLLELKFLAKEAGLPEGCECLDVLPSMALVRSTARPS